MKILKIIWQISAEIFQFAKKIHVYHFYTKSQLCIIVKCNQFRRVNLELLINF